MTDPSTGMTAYKQMRMIARASNEAKDRLFTRALAKMPVLSEGVIEKDFWVCVTLERLFHAASFKDFIWFKGGTSLSKCYGAINRFSEDIDLIVDWRLLGIPEMEPLEQRSRTKQKLYNQHMREMARAYVGDTMLPQIREELSDVMGSTADCEISPDDGGTILFAYPQTCSLAPGILKHIKIEIGPMSSWKPLDTSVVSPYAALAIPDPSSMGFTVPAISAVRAFWEKVTILHKEAHRPDAKDVPLRYSRHYYDVFMLTQTSTMEQAIADMRLLDDVREFELRFFPTGWAKMEEARPGSFRLRPSAKHLGQLREDYRQMRGMLFGNSPTFDEIIEGVDKLEVRLNSL